MNSIEIVLRATPVSQQARRRENLQAWKDRIASAARKASRSQFLSTSWGLSVTIVHYFESTTIDVDNLPKPILDAMKGVFYLDDGQIQELIVQRHSLSEEFSIETASNVIRAELDRGGEFVYIRVTVPEETER